MKHFWKGPGIALAIVALVAGGWASAADDLATTQTQPAFKHVGPQQATVGLSPQQYLQRQAALHDWLTGQIPVGTMADPLTVRPSQEELAELAEPPSGPGPVKVGVVEQLDPMVSVSCRAAGRSGKNPRCSGGGTLEFTDDGGFVWARSIRSVGATGVRLHVIGMSLPADADMFFYSSNGEAYGPYHGAGPNDDGDFWLPSVMTDSGVLVVRHYGPNGKADLPYLTVTLSEIGHIGPGIGGGDDTVRGDGDLCQYNASCIQNATCQSSGPATDAESAAAKMLWVAGCCIYICSGGLIADTDNSTEIPYFLTANHCISKGNAANNLEAFFQYQKACNSNPCPVGSFQAPPTPKTVGSSIVSTSRSGDYTLLQLDQSPPSGSVFLGWNSAPIAFTQGAALHRISYPSGAPQAYSAHSVNTTSSTCLSTARGEFIYSNDTFGATEGGSSGSPVVNAAGEIVGQLTGCCGSNCNNVCDSASNRTIDGAFAFYFSSVEQYLDPSGGGCTPTTASCSDGIDNDCDGLIDCNDTNGAEDCSAAPECQSGGSCVNPGGAPVGSSCSSNSQCCSNKCKGPPGNQTCR